MQTNDLLAAARAEAAEFKRLREPAIAGNWTARAEDESKKLWTVRESLTLYDGEFCFHDKPTAKFIAHAANHAQEIAAHVESLCAEVERLQKEVEHQNNSLSGLQNLVANIADTCRSRGFGPGKQIDERVIAMATALDAAKARIDQLESEGE